MRLFGGLIFVAITSILIGIVMVKLELFSNEWVGPLFTVLLAFTGFLMILRIEEKP